jgi:hypothetical protein
MSALPRVAAILLGMAFVFPACAAAPEPTEAEITALAQQDIARANAPVIEYQQRLGKGEVPQDMLVQLKALRKKACHQETEEAWRCDVEMDMHVPNGGFRSRELTLRLVHDAKGWQASRAQ